MESAKFSPRKKCTKKLVCAVKGRNSASNKDEIGENIITCPEVVNEVTNKRQIRRLAVLPYNLINKEVFPENIKIVTDFSKQTGDYPSLSATDIKVIALTYQLEIEKVGSDHLRSKPLIQRASVSTNTSVHEVIPNVTGFYVPVIPDKNKNNESSFQEAFVSEATNVLSLGDQLEQEAIFENYVNGDENNANHNQTDKKNYDNSNPCENIDNDGTSIDDNEEEEDDGDENGWITLSNVDLAKNRVNSDLIEDRQVTVACMTSDFAMQNVLKQMNLNVTALDGRLIKTMRTYIMRCYSCFKTTSIITKKFCPSCGNNTLKKVAVSLDENGKMVIHINTKRPLTARGKKYSLPRIKGGKHPSNPILVADQPIPDNRSSRLARTKNNPLDDDYIAGFSPFILRDVNSKSAQLCIRPSQETKHWMRKNSNEARKRRK